MLGCTSIVSCRPLTISMGSMLCLPMASMCAWLLRMARMPPCTPGCRVLTRPATETHYVDTCLCAVQPLVRGTSPSQRTGGLDVPLAGVGVLPVTKHAASIMSDYIRSAVARCHSSPALQQGMCMPTVLLTIQHLWEASQLSDLLHRDASGLNGLGAATGGHQLIAQVRQALRRAHGVHK
jgi:hypothetical protein